VSTRRAAFAIPGDITTQTGGYIYDSHLLRRLREQGRDVVLITLGSSYPDPTPEDATDAAEKLAAVPSDCPVIIDGLALGALDPAALVAMSAPVVALVHHPLAYEGGLDAARREHLLETERANLRRAAHVVVTSPHTAELVRSDYGVSGEHITIARPGIDRVSHPREPVDPPLILSVGIQLPRKGHDVLLRALAGVAHLPWQAVIAGQVLDEAYGASLVRLRDELGLGARVSLAGPVSAFELETLYRQASVFALATRFEGYGMVFGEAMAHGLPIVTCRTGAVPDTVAAGAGVLVEPDDPDGFSSALSRVLQDDTLRDAMAEESARAGTLLASWSVTAALVGAVLDRVSSRDDGTGIVVETSSSDE
jgi:glycosyltransferase involved in cell wall biosynthesis